MDPREGHYTKLRTAHHRMLLRILGAWRKSPNKRILSHKDALQRTECESIETTVRMRRLLWSGALLRMGDYRLAKRVMSGELENAGKRGPGVKEKEWTDCVAKDLRLFGITGDWSTVALDPGAWYGTVREGGCGFMPAWVKEEEYASALQCGKLTENLQVPSSSPHKRGKVPAVDDVAVVTTAAATAAVDATEIGPPGGDRWCRGGCLPHPPRPRLQVLPMAPRAFRVVPGAISTSYRGRTRCPSLPSSPRLDLTSPPPL